MAQDFAAFDEIRDCGICLEQMLNPKILPCQHSFCESCIGKLGYLDSSYTLTVKCPVCSRVFSFDEIRTDFRLVKFMDRLEEMSLSVSGCLWIPIGCGEATWAFQKTDPPAG